MATSFRRRTRLFARSPLSRYGVAILCVAATVAFALLLRLSISRSIIEAHGGRLSVAANLPHGAIFQFTLTMDLGVAAGVQVARILGAVP